MIRKILLPAAAVLLLGGCMTSGYGYRSGPGDYYYGEPGVDYRYYRSPYYGGYYGGYGYPSYYRDRWGYYGYGGYYGSPYYPYYPGYYYRPRPDQPPVNGGGQPPPPRSDRDDPPPWRNLEELRRRAENRDAPAVGARRPVPQAIREPRALPRPAVQPRRPTPTPQSRRGSRVEQAIRRARGGGESDGRLPPR